MKPETNTKGDVTSSTVAFWIGQIDAYEQNFQPWEKRSKEIIDRYRDERKGGNKNKARFNILWSNVQTLAPALYATPPIVNIDRRFQDDDDLGRYSALVLERATMYYVNHDLFDNVMRQMVLDRLLSGRGTPWIRYVPTFKDVEQITDDATMQSDDGKEEPEQELYAEDVVPDYVHWQDFGHTWARTWQEVRGVWRKVYLSRAELVKRFGDVGKTIQLDAKPRTDDGKETEAGKKATVYEIWDKTKKKALWVHRDHPEVLDEREDPLRLKDFFPCPKPLYATLTNDSLIPVPDFIQYQDQARRILSGGAEPEPKRLSICTSVGYIEIWVEGMSTTSTNKQRVPFIGMADSKSVFSSINNSMYLSNNLTTSAELYKRQKIATVDSGTASTYYYGIGYANNSATAPKRLGIRWFVGSNLCYILGESGQEFETITVSGSFDKTIGYYPYFGVQFKNTGIVERISKFTVKYG